MDNSPKKSFKRFNIIDLIIILVVIAIFFFAVNIIMNNILLSESKLIEYTVKISETDPGNQYYFSVGDKMYAGPTQTNVGNIKKIQPKSAETTIFDYSLGEFKQTYIKGKYDIYITVRATCSVKNNMYSIGDIKITANNNPEFNIPFSFKDIEIINVQEITDNSNTGGKYEEN